MTHRSDDIEAIALLEEPVRRALYEWVVAQRDAVGRDAAAAAVGVSRSLAAFHLDRLVREGLLTPEFRRLSGRTGPGAGRPSKLYRRGGRELAVSLPDRDYETAARLMAESLGTLESDGSLGRLRTSARRSGLAVGATARGEAGPRPGRARLRAALLSTLSARGYEPRELVGGEIRLANCPFHALVARHRDVVCGMNSALADGILAGLGDGALEADLDSQPGWCCVAFRTTPTS
jgi:predicted ArsR family transcriptional regulator